MICKLICDWLFQNVGIIAVAYTRDPGDPGSQAYTSLYLHRNETGSRSRMARAVETAKRRPSM